MGLFDTLIFDESIICPNCNSEIEDVQTKVFDNTLSYYKIGDILNTNIEGLIEQDLYCTSCNSWNLMNIYLVIKDQILIAMEIDKKIAENKFIKFNIDTMRYLYKKVYREKEIIKESKGKLIEELYTYINWFEGDIDEKTMPFLNYEIKDFKRDNPLEALREVIKRNF